MWYGVVIALVIALLVLVVLGITIAVFAKSSKRRGETGEDIVRKWKEQDRKRGRVL